MAITLDPDKSYVVYESWKKKRNFYCIERTGYTKVSDLVNDFLYHAIDVHNAMTVSNITFVETYKVDLTTFASNPEYFTHNYTPSLVERKRAISIEGVGYAVGDELEFLDPNATVNNVQEGRETLKIKVTSIDSKTGGITDFRILHPGSYRTPTGSNKSLVFRTKPNPFAADTLHLDISYETDNRGPLAGGFTNTPSGNIFVFQSRHEGIGNVWVVTAAPGTVGNPALGYWQSGPTPVKSYKGAVCKLESVHFSIDSASMVAGYAAVGEGVAANAGVPAATVPADFTKLAGVVMTANPTYKWTWYHWDAGTNKTALQTTYDNIGKVNKSFVTLAGGNFPSVLGLDPWTQTFGYDHSSSIPLTTQTAPFGSGETTGGRGGEGDLVSLDVRSFPIGSQFTYHTSYDPSGQSFYGNLTRWPTDGIWCNVNVATNTVIFPGQEIILVKSQSNSESYINANTFITEVATIEVVDGVKEVRTIKPQTIGYRPDPGSATGGKFFNTKSVGTNTFFETTSRYIWFKTSQPIKIDKGDRFVVRGNGAMISDTETITPEKFSMITEVAASADALADSQGFTANVRSLDTVTGNMFLADMSTTHTRISAYPYLGQQLTLVTPSVAAAAASYAIVGNLNAVISNIANVNVDNGTANITVAVPQGAVLQHSIVKFNFPVLQPWRMAFKASNSQQLNVFAGTKIQLQDNGEIARVTDYTGSVNDISGLIGDVPSVKIFSATERATVNIQFGHVLAGLNVGGTAYNQFNAGTVGTPAQFLAKYGVDPAFTIAVTNVASGMVKEGFEFDTSTGAGALGPNKILYQLPLDPLKFHVTGGIGIYVVEKNNLLFNPAALVNNILMAKVEDIEVDPNDITQGFINRALRVGAHPESYPLSFMATFTTRGIFFGVWEGSWTVMQKSRARQVSEKDAWFNWVLCQRPVDRNTGHTRTNGQSPVFCVNSVGYKYWKFVVRERDTVHPTQGDRDTKHYVWNKQLAANGGVYEKTTRFRVPADKHTEDSHALLNTTEQIALTEDSKYLVSFLYNLTTPRFRYSDELDMIGQTAADVAMASNNLKLKTYGEADDRTYRSLGANLPYNMGLRIVVLNDLYQN